MSYTYKNSHTTKINLKYQLQRGLKNLNYPTDHMLYRIMKIIWSLLSQNMKKKADNPPIRIYVNKINMTTFKIETKY